MTQIKTCANCGNCGGVSCPKSFEMIALQAITKNIQMPSKARSLFQNGNHKMIVTSAISEFDFYSFSMPVRVTCAGAGDCLNWCFAGVGRGVSPSVILGAMRNLKEICGDRDLFVAKTVKELSKLQAKSLKNGRHGIRVRINDKGDMANSEMFAIWYEIAALMRDIRFYFYTKSWHLMPLDLPANMRFLQSMGSSHDEDIDWNSPVVIVRPFGSPLPPGQIEGGVSDWLASEATGPVIFSIEAHGALKRRVKAKKILA